MAIVDVGFAVSDLFMLSDQVLLTDKTDKTSKAIFGRELYDVDFAALRVTGDRWHLVKARKAIDTRDGVGGVIRTEHAYIRPPIVLAEPY